MILSFGKDAKKNIFVFGGGSGDWFSLGLSNKRTCESINCLIMSLQN